MNRSSYHYRSCRSEQGILKKQIREIAQTRVRYGYRRIHVLLRRKGWSINANRVYRLHRREDRQPAKAPDGCGSIDGRCDELFEGRRIWILTIGDHFSRVIPGISLVGRPVPAM